jgi:hypothetical protein
MLIAIVILLALILLTFIFILFGIIVSNKDCKNESDSIANALGNYLCDIRKQIDDVCRLEAQNRDLLHQIRDLLKTEKEKKTIKTTKKKDDLK